MPTSFPGPFPWLGGGAGKCPGNEVAFCAPQKGPQTWQPKSNRDNCHCRVLSLITVTNIGTFFKSQNACRKKKAWGLVFTSDPNIRANTIILISRWQRFWHKNRNKRKYRHNYQNFPFNFLVLALMLAFALQQVKTKSALTHNTSARISVYHMWLCQANENTGYRLPRV